MSAADPAGTYGLKYTTPLVQFSGNGERRVLKEIEVIERVEFRPGHELRYWRYSDGAPKPEMTSSSGAWLTQGDRLFYLMAFGASADDVGRLGMSVVGASPEGLELKPGAGFGLLLGATKAVRLDRVTGDAAVFPGTAKDFTKNLQDLQAMVSGISRDVFVGATSKDALIREALRAFQAKDITALMKLSYPTSGPYMEDERLQVYLKYQLLFAGRAIDKLEEEGKDSAAFVSLYGSSKQAGIDFPEPIVAEGWFKATKTMTNGSSANLIFYGRIGERWAIIGDPLNLKELPKPTATK